MLNPTGNDEVDEELSFFFLFPFSLTTVEIPADSRSKATQKKRLGLTLGGESDLQRST